MRRDTVLLLLALLIAGSLVLTPPQRDLLVGDETKYGRIVWEMRQSGELLVPTLEGRPYSHKPPLHFWIVYGLSFIFGTSSTWPFILPSLIAFVLLLLLVRKFSRELFGGSGMLAVFIFSTFYLAWGIAQTARMDLLFVLLVSFAALHLYRFLDQSSLLALSHSRSSLIWAGAAVGVAVLVKGPMAFVIVASVLIIESIRRRRWPRGNYVVALLLAAGIPLLWLIPALRAGGRDYTHDILVTQNLSRAVNAWVHREPPWWYLQRLPLTFFPWFLLGIISLIDAFRSSERKNALPAHEQPADRSSLLAPPSGRDARLFCVSWFLAVLIPFSLLSSKLDVYMVPALVPMALLAADFVERTSLSRTLALWHSRLEAVAVIGNRLILLFLALLLVTIPLLARRFAGQLQELQMLRQPLPAGLFWTGAAVAAAALLWSIRSAEQHDRLFRSVVALGVGAIYPLVYLAAFLMPMVNETTSTRPLVRALMKQTSDGRQIGLWTSPHLWTPDMPASYREAEYLGRDRLRQPGPKPRVLVTRADRAHHLGRELLEQYRRVDQFRMRGKSFDVYLRR
jgi:4-amino-4-deoxy-L-arabinose transferase-like glycosyltransferase